MNHEGKSIAVQVIQSLAVCVILATVFFFAVIAPLNADASDACDELGGYYNYGGRFTSASCTLPGGEIVNPIKRLESERE